MAAAVPKPAASHPCLPSAQASRQQNGASSHQRAAADAKAVPASNATLAAPRRRSSSGAKGKPGAPADPEVPGRRAGTLRLATQICKRVASSRNKWQARAVAGATQMVTAGTVARGVMGPARGAITTAAAAGAGGSGVRAGAGAKASGVVVRTAAAAAVKLKRVVRPHKVRSHAHYAAVQPLLCFTAQHPRVTRGLHLNPCLLCV